MDARFNKVVIRNRTEQEQNIHLAVHPFTHPKLQMMLHKGHYTDWNETEPMVDWKRRLADALFDLPGVNHLFFASGLITIQHHGVFDDATLIEAATEIIRPFLEESLRLEALS